jgi:hypothetical protein
MPGFLRTGESYEGAWHVEGMSHEEIVATVDFILDRDEELVGGDIEFKRAFLEKEADVFFAICNQARSVFQSCSFPVSLNQRTARSRTRLRFLTILSRYLVFPQNRPEGSGEVVEQGIAPLGRVPYLIPIRVI